MRTLTRRAIAQGTLGAILAASVPCLLGWALFLRPARVVRVEVFVRVPEPVLVPVAIPCPPPQAAPTPNFREMAIAAAGLCGVDESVFLELVRRESDWIPYAVSTSAEPAIGLAQIKASTLRDLDPTFNVWEPWDNLLGAACYLRAQYDRFGTWRAALHAYHAGPNRKATGKGTLDYAEDIVSRARASDAAGSSN